MPRPALRKSIVAVLMSGLTILAQSQETDSRWRLRMMDLKRQVKVEATVRFLGAPATESCMGGTWKRLVVEARLAYDDEFFPLGAPLAYQLEGNKLTLGRTAVCDVYLFMSGRSGKSTMQGTYDAVSIETGQKLGSFTLTRVP